MWFRDRTRVLFDKLKEEASVRAEVQRVLELLERQLGAEGGRDDLRREWSGGFGVSGN